MRRDRKPAKAKLGATPPVARTSRKNEGSRDREFETRLAEALEQLQTRNRELLEAQEQQTATSEILRVIASSPTDVGPVFATILDKAMILAGAQLGVLWRYEGDELFRAVEVRGAGPESRTLWQQPQRLGRPFFRTSGPWKPAQILDVRESEPYRRREPLWVNNAEQEGMRTLLNVPLVSDAHYLGAISLYRREVRAFTEKEIALLLTFADQAVIAIENVRLFNETKEALEDGVEQLPRLLRVPVGQQLHGALQIAEEHRDLLALTFESPLGGEDFLGEVLGGVGFWGGELGLGRRSAKLSATSTTEVVAWLVGETAGWTSSSQGGPTLRAEAAALAILMLAPGTLHHGPPVGQG